MKMFGAPFLNKPLRPPMDFECHSFQSLPHLGSCSILSYLAFFWPFSLSANTQKSTHSCRHTLSHNSVWLKFRMLPFFKVCVSVYEWGLYGSKQVRKCMPQACMWRWETIFPEMLLSVYLVEEGSLLFLLLSSIYKADFPVFVSHLA